MVLSYILWLSLGMLILAAIFPSNQRCKSFIGGAGWIVFSLHWFAQPFHYLAIGDYFNSVATIVAAVLCVFLGIYLLLHSTSTPNSQLKQVFRATNATAIGGMIYFMFAEIPSLNYWLIANVTSQTEWLLNSIGFFPIRLSWNVISLNNEGVEIILACTAIESIALFAGVTLACIDASFKRVILAFLASVPVIYLLNLIRNVFVIAAYGFAWFGSPDYSFYLAHHVIAKIGSTIALFVIAYVVLNILPELLDMIDGIFNMVKSSIKRYIGG